jgi:hypothetical protein
MLFQPLDFNLTVQTMQDTIHAPHERDCPTCNIKEGAKVVVSYRITVNYCQKDVLRN